MTEMAMILAKTMNCNIVKKCYSTGWVLRKAEGFLGKLWQTNLVSGDQRTTFQLIRG